MVSIATLTMNPALDITTATGKVEPTHKLRCIQPRYDPGGGGINVARVITELGGHAQAIFPTGGATGERLLELVTEAGVTARGVSISGDNRESFTVDEGDTGEQFRFVLPGPELSDDEQAACLAELEQLDKETPFLIVSGSMPPGVPPAFLTRITAHARATGVAVVLDMASEALHGVRGAHLIKPNLRELEQLVGHAVAGEAEIGQAAHALIDEGIAANVLVSMGGDGAVLVTAEIERSYPPIAVPQLSAVGAGDAMVGALTLALSNGLPIEEAVRHGMAAGAAALMTPATELVHRADFERLLGSYHIH